MWLPPFIWSYDRGPLLYQAVPASVNTAVDKRVVQINNFLISQQNIYSGYTLEAPWQGASNEYPQHMFH